MIECMHDMCKHIYIHINTCTYNSQVQFPRRIVITHRVIDMIIVNTIINNSLMYFLYNLYIVIDFNTIFCHK